MNGDGRITSVDMLLAQRHVLNFAKLSGAKLEAADANHDGKIRSVDMLLMQRHALGFSRLKQNK